MHGISSVVSKTRRMDEQFVLVGYVLIRNLLRRKYCKNGMECFEGHLLDTNYGGTSLGLWLNYFYIKEVIKKLNIGIYIVPMNAYVSKNENNSFLHMIEGKYQTHSKDDNFFNYKKTTQHGVEVGSYFCNNYLLWHKASINDQRYLQDHYDLQIEGFEIVFDRFFWLAYKVYIMRRETTFKN